MGLVVNTNVSSLIAQRNLSNNTQSVNKSFERLASGLRINRAADDAAGLLISETLSTQVRGNQKAVANAQDGMNVLQIAEGALGVISENLQRIRELTIQSANDTNSTVERQAIAQEVTARLNDIDRIANSTRGNNVFLLNGSKTNYLLQVGANSETAENTLQIGQLFATASITALGGGMVLANATAVGAAGYFLNNSSARLFIGTIDSAIKNVNNRRSQLGAMQNALNSTIESLTVAVENLKANNARIKDLDIASESANLIRNQILQQSALSILSQANQAPTLALKLLQ